MDTYIVTMTETRQLSIEIKSMPSAEQARIAARQLWENMEIDQFKIDPSESTIKIDLVLPVTK